MIYGVYAIRDQLVGFGNPSIAVNDEVAERQFQIIVNDSNNSISVSPKYYDLYKIGEYDDETGALKPLDLPQMLLTGLSVKKGDKDGV